MGGWKTSAAYQIAMAVNFCVALVAIGCTLTKHILLSSETPGALEFTRFCAAICASIKNVARAAAGRRQPTTDDVDVYTQLVIYATFAVLLSNLTWVINALLSYASLFGLLSLPYGVIATVVRVFFHLFAKISLYVILLTQLQSGFRGLFRFSNKIIYWLAAMVIMYVIAMCFMVAHFITERRSFLQSNSDFPAVYTMISLLYDVLFLSKVVLMFNKAVRHTLQSVADTLNSDELSTHLALVKYSLLCDVMLASALISLTVFAATGAALFMPFDAIIDCVCVVLMTKSWSQLFVAGCAPMLRRTTNVSCLPCGGPEAERSINLLVANAQTAAMDSATAMSLDMAETQVSALASVLPQSQAPALATVHSTEDSSSVR